MASSLVVRLRYLVVVAALFLAVGLIVGKTLYHWQRNESEVTPEEVNAIIEPGNSSSSELTKESKTGFHFTDVASRAGVDFEYYGGPSQYAHMTEQNGGGVSVFDFDRDGTPDIFLANGSRFDTSAGEAGESSRLYQSTGMFEYRDVTYVSCLESFGFGMGTCAGDYDNDGFVDLFLACYGRNRLWRNNGDGTFTDITDAAGVGDESWGTSAAFADLDNDGLLDLYVVNYVDWSPDDEPCTISEESNVRIVCSPMTRSGQADLLFKNDGSGAFRNVGREAGIALDESGKGLALSVADFNSDGFLDLYIVNDTTKNFLFLNRSKMLFEESAVRSGVALSGNGVQGAGMGVGIADYDRNGHLDLCVTNFQNQTNDLYANLGDAAFAATNSETGLDLISRPWLSFGVIFADFNMDRWPDLFVANGHIWDKRPVAPDAEYEMPSQLIGNLNGRRFIEVSAEAGEYFSNRWIARSVAAGDLDNDGDTDLVIQRLAAGPAVLRNDFSGESHAVSVEVIGTVSSRQPLGRSIRILDEGEEFVLRVPSGDSFQASHHDRVLFAAANDSSIDQIKIKWATGIVELWSNVYPEQRRIRLIEGTGDEQRNPMRFKD